MKFLIMVVVLFATVSGIVATTGFPCPVVAPPTPPAANNAPTITLPPSDIRDPIAHIHKKKHFPWKVVAPSLVAGVIVVLAVILLLVKSLRQTSTEVPAQGEGQGQGQGQGQEESSSSSSTRTPPSA